jgi:hypothetical protein
VPVGRFITLRIRYRAKTIVITPAAGTIQNIPGNISPLFPPSAEAQALIVYLRALRIKYARLVWKKIEQG